MARLKSFKELKKERNSLHSDAESTYTVFSDDAGNRYLQIDTYGSKERKLIGKVSQSIQLDQRGAYALRALIDKAFPS